jgi:sugar phosphate isomerase/epimerase
LGLAIEAAITHAQLTDSLADPKQTPLDLKGSIDLAADLGAPLVTFHMGGYHDGIAREKEWRRAVAHIKAAADYGAAKHIALAVDGIWPEWMDDTPDALEKLFDDVDAATFGVNFDPCYLTLMGVDPVGFVKRFHKRIPHAHLKDHRGKYPKWTHFIPGRGDMDYSPIFRALEQYKFSGAAAVECFTDMKFEDACDSGYAAMMEAAKKAGVKFAAR